MRFPQWMSQQNASPATAKGHMKRPRHGMRSTTPKRKDSPIDQPQNIVPELLIPALLPMQPVKHDPNMPNLIRDEDDDETIANVFCFGAFADKHIGVVYNALTSVFPFMSLDGCRWFFLLYNYKLNAILVTPISGMDNVSIFDAYKKQFNVLTAKGLKPKINIMDNQATKHIKKSSQSNNVKCSLSSRITTKRMQPNTLSRLTKMHLLLCLQPLTKTSPSNCGTNWLHRYKTH
jgi:hypothetical protein